MISANGMFSIVFSPYIYLYEQRPANDGMIMIAELMMAKKKNHRGVECVGNERVCMNNEQETRQAHNVT